MVDSSVYNNGRRQYARPQAMLWADNPGTLSNGVYIPTGYEVGNDTYWGGGLSQKNFMILTDQNRKPIDFSNQRIENRQRMVNGRMRSYYTADKLTISTSWEMIPSRSYAFRPNFKVPYSITGITASAGSVTYTAPGHELKAGDYVTITGTTNFDNIGKLITGVVAGTSFTITSSQTGAFVAGGIAYDVNVGKSVYEGSINEFTVDGGAGGAEILDWYESRPGSFWVYLAYDKYTNFGQNDAAYGHLAEYNQVLEMYITDFSYSVQKRGAHNMDLWTISVKLEEV